MQAKSHSMFQESVQGSSLDDFLQAKSHSMFQEFGVSDASTAVSAEEEAALMTPPTGLSDDEYADHSATMKICLTDSLGLWSVGSAGHATGTCKPCAFLWKDPKQPGCQNGRECEFCHLCPPGEMKKHKKYKRFLRKSRQSYNVRYQNVANSIQAQYQNGVTNGFEGHYQNEIGTSFGGW